MTSILPQRHHRAADDPALSPGAAVSPDRSRGRRLLAALDAIERFPVLAVTRTRVLSATGDGRSAAETLVQAIETDAAAALAVLRAANVGTGRPHAVGSIREAVAALGPLHVSQLVRGLPSADFFQAVPSFGASPDAVRLHAVAVKQITARLAVMLERRDYDELIVAALLHDVGKLVLHHAFGDHLVRPPRRRDTPEERVDAERRALGFDHAALGGLVARRAGLPRRIATAIEGHHRSGPVAGAAVVRLADMLVHYAAGQRVAPNALTAAATDLGIGADALRELMYELPAGGRATVRTRESPLTPAEVAVLRRVAEGKLYKQIATELGRSTSTIRSHLHNLYAKLEVHDRAQAVLLATEQCWI